MLNLNCPRSLCEHFLPPRAFGRKDPVRKKKKKSGRFSRPSSFLLDEAAPRLGGEGEEGVHGGLDDVGARLSYISLVFHFLARISLVPPPIETDPVVDPVAYKKKRRGRDATILRRYSFHSPTIFVVYGREKRKGENEQPVLDNYPLSISPHYSPGAGHRLFGGKRGAFSDHHFPRTTPLCANAAPMARSEEKGKEGKKEGREIRPICNRPRSLHAIRGQSSP